MSEELYYIDLASIIVALKIAIFKKYMSTFFFWFKFLILRIHYKDGPVLTFIRYKQIDRQFIYMQRTIDVAFFYFNELFL